jgi:lipopolysaccharide/colanic/teichoic acid biosynthesis glycosyltransferase
MTLLSGEAVASGTAVLAALLLGGEAGRPTAVWSLFPLVFLLAVGGQAVMHTYGPARERRGYLRSALGAMVSVGYLYVLGLLYPSFRLAGGEYLVLALGLGAGFALVRLAVEYLIRHIYSRELGRRRTLIIGKHEAAWNIKVHMIASDDRQAHVVGHLAPDGEEDPTALGGLHELRDLIEEHDIRSVIVSAQLDSEDFKEVVRCCLLHGASVSVVPAELSAIPCRFSSQQLALILLAPLGLLIAAAIKHDSPGSAIFRQKRLGLGGRPFWVYKFRSMRPEAEKVLEADPFLYRRYVENDYKLPVDEDPRITRTGRFLRRTSLDELPQLVNVLKGDMSLVGPRPVVPDEIEHYGPDARVFLAVKPGLTGHWQINGRSDVGYPERAELDIDYITNWTLGEDLRILAGTFRAVLSRQGAH